MEATSVLDVKIDENQRGRIELQQNTPCVCRRKVEASGVLRVCFVDGSIGILSVQERLPYSQHDVRRFNGGALEPIPGSHQQKDFTCVAGASMAMTIKAKET
jgi:hypothetical protein